MNTEHERRQEFERRKKLRLLQVRQQSKEFSDKLRERVKGEIIQEKKKYLEAENKLKQEKHLQELCQLKELYDRCLESIGEGHKEAAKQPDLNLVKEAELTRISARAGKRGAKALKKQLVDEAVQKEKVEAPIKQKKATRNKENLRACYISSLPKYAENYRPRSISPPKPFHQHKEPQETRRVLEEIPSNLADCELRLQASQEQKSPEKLNFLRLHPKDQVDKQSKKLGLPEVVAPANKSEDSLLNVSSPKDCSCDYIVCSCHKSPEELRRSSSESRISSEKVLDFEEPRKKRVRSRSCSPLSVRTLNYFGCGNVYESNQQSCVRVTRHSRSPKRSNDESLNKNTIEEFPVSKPSVEEIKKRTDERSAKALRKEQLKRDFQQLVQNLKKLTQEKVEKSSKNKGKLRVYSSERDILTRNETKQKKLNDAFEKLPHSVKSSITQNTGEQNPNKIPINDSSPPTLNLALCEPNMAARSDSPSVLVNKDPSGDVHITVKVSEVLSGKGKGKEKGKSKSKCRSPGSDSSYMQPPPNLTPSQQQLINALLCQVNKRAIGKDMKKYIKKLLKMSKDNIDSLHSPGSRQPQVTNSPPDEEIEKDLVKLNELAEVYAEKVRTLVGMYEQMNSPAYSPACSPTIDPIRSPPRQPPTPTHPVTPREFVPPLATRRRRGICPSPGDETPTTTRGRGQPTSSGYGRTSQPRYTPRRQPPTPQQIGAALRQHRQPNTTPPCTIPSSSTRPPAAPPNSPASRPIAGGRQPGGPPAPPTTRLGKHDDEPGGKPRYPDPIPLVRSKHPRNFNHHHRKVPTPQLQRAPPPPNQPAIDEELSDDTLNAIFGGIPGFAVPSRAELAERAAIYARIPHRASPPPDDWDMAAYVNEKMAQINRIGIREEEPSGPSSSGGGGGFGEFGDFCGGQEDLANMGFHEDFTTGADTILQEEAPDEDRVDYPEDFPPPTDLFEPGFDWDTANMDQPSFPSSFPGDPVGGGSMSSEDQNVCLDTTFDTSALQGPVDPQRINNLRMKLSNICNDQYREIIEMLQQDSSKHQLEYGKLLQRAVSDPFIDPDSTLAPIPCPPGSSPRSGPTHLTPPPRDPNCPPTFSQTGRTPPGDLRIEDDCSPNTPSNPSSPEFDDNLEYADFDDVYSNMDNLLLLMRAQQGRS